MGHRCVVCDRESTFIIWSSSRNFPRKKLAEKLGIGYNKKNRLKMVRIGYPVCMKCYNKLKEEI